MGSWYNAREDEWVDFEAPVPELWISENPVVGTLLGPDGAVVAVVTERPPPSARIPTGPEDLMRGHVHTIPVDASMTAEEAWKELCIFGRRLTFTGVETWANVRCSGEECRLIEGSDAERR